MVAFARGSVVLVPFPFSDLSRAKLRPSIVLADSGRGDWILCQVTSKSYGDGRAIALTEMDFQTGGLQIDSFVRPAKLFTAHESLVRSQAGHLQPVAFARIRAAVLQVFEDPR